jgi:hypothetical protein
MAKSKGLGDSIAKVTHALGIDRVAEAVAKLAGAPGCGCEERKQYLNELFPYGKVRKFKVLRDFNIEGNDYLKGAIVKITKEDPLHQHVIFLYKDGFIEEI